MSRADRFSRLRQGALSWFITLLIVIVVSFAFGAMRAPDLPQRAPNFRAQTMDGQTVELSAMAGRKVLLNFWATWCGPCRFEVPALSRFDKRHPEITVWGIAAEPVERLQHAIDELDIDYQVLRGSPDVLATYGITTFPTTILIDTDGHIHSAHVGAMWDPQLEFAAWGM